MRGLRVLIASVESKIPCFFPLCLLCFLIFSKTSFHILQDPSTPLLPSRLFLCLSCEKPELSHCADAAQHCVWASKSSIRRAGTEIWAARVATTGKLTLSCWTTDALSRCRLSTMNSFQLETKTPLFYFLTYFFAAFSLIACPCIQLLLFIPPTTPKKRQIHMSLGWFEIFSWYRTAERRLCPFLKDALFSVWESRMRTLLRGGDSRAASRLTGEAKKAAEMLPLCVASFLKRARGCTHHCRGHTKNCNKDASFYGSQSNESNIMIRSIHSITSYASKSLILAENHSRFLKNV